MRTSARNDHRTSYGMHAAAALNHHLRSAGGLWALAALCVGILAAAAAPLQANGIKGEILDQQVTSGKGYTVLRVWGSHYDMGYAHGWLLHGEINTAIGEMKSLFGGLYNTARSIVSTNTVWKPDEIEDDLDGMVAALVARGHSIDKLDLKVSNLYSDLGYMSVSCRSHSCWGHLVADPVTALSTRRLDFGTPIPSCNHHVVCVWLPTDGSPAWANLAFAGYVAVVTAVNEFGTQASLHDYNSSSGTPISPWLARSVAARYALTMVTDPNLATHADYVYGDLHDNYNAGTGSFINYYVPQGHGGVITCRRTPSPTFYKLRKPHPSYFSGDVLITTNSETDGSYTPSGGEFMADYYQDLEDANETATLLGHWDVMGNEGLHKMSIAYRERGDLTVWVDGRTDPGRTARVELEWTDLDDALKTLTLEVSNPARGTVDVDPNQPVYEPNQIVTLTATANPDKQFTKWKIWDPNYPDDGNYVVIDTNDSIVIVMDADRHVKAFFKCGGGGAGQLLPALVIGVAVCGLASRRMRRGG